MTIHELYDNIRKYLEKKYNCNFSGYSYSNDAGDERSRIIFYSEKHQIGFTDYQIARYLFNHNKDLGVYESEEERQKAWKYYINNKYGMFNLVNSSPLEIRNIFWSDLKNEEINQRKIFTHLELLEFREQIKGDSNNGKDKPQ